VSAPFPFSPGEVCEDDFVADGYYLCVRCARDETYLHNCTGDAPLGLWMAPCTCQDPEACEDSYHHQTCAQRAHRGAQTYLLRFGLQVPTQRRNGWTLYPHIPFTRVYP
jgi:hypothetical protein